MPFCIDSQNMRCPRSLQLYEPTGFVHMFWRCHNREFYLALDKFKALYLRCLKRSFKKKVFKENVKLHAYCAMDNHFHNVVRYFGSSRIFSDFMRTAHGIFGSLYNKINNRSGKVAEGRPKTPLIQNDEHVAWVQIYVEANPVRARKIPLEKLKSYKYSSYRYYAYGVQDEFTEVLTPPQWYLDLGKTARQRQAKYRKLFARYLKDKGFEPNGFLAAFIGTQIWVSKQTRRIRKDTDRGIDSYSIETLTDSS